MKVTCAALAVVLSPSGAIGQTPTPTTPEPYIRMGYVVQGYFGEDYTTRPLHEYAFFQGEPISFGIAVYNSGPTDTTLQVADSERLFQVVSLKAPAPAPNATVERPLAVDRRRFADEEEISIPVTFSAPAKTWPGGEFDVLLNRETRLSVGEGLRWAMRLPADLDPGLYRVQVRLNATQRGKPLYEDTVVRFEVRARHAEDQPELLRREALRRLENGDKAGARDAAGELLKQHPNSALAYAILENIALNEGRTEEAATHRGNKKTVLANGRHDLLLKYQKKMAR